MPQTQVEIHYSGTVQGVGFRYTVRHLASRFEVTGFVRNLRDGRVQLVAEGEKGEIDQFLEAIDDSLGGYVRQKDVRQNVATKQFASFDIRF